MSPRFESPPPASVNRAPLFVTYGRMRLTGYFRHSLPDYRGGMKVVVQSDRGVELGEVNVNHCAVCPAGGSCSKPRNQGRRAGEGSPIGRVLRAATDNDIADGERLADDDRRIRDRVREIVAVKGLPMRVVEVERLLGGDRLLVYFASENRVDFRELVRELAREFQIRVEMRQIGSRDEAKLLGEGYGRCGEPLCCQTFLQDLRNVPMRMAKTQKATLDPSKVSGRCGRLMCCLRYEDATYEDLKRRLPSRGSRVATADGPATVLDVQILTQLVLVQLDGRGRAAFEAEELSVLDEPRRYDPESESGVFDPNDSDPHETDQEPYPVEHPPPDESRNHGEFRVRPTVQRKPQATPAAKSSATELDATELSSAEPGPTQPGPTETLSRLPHDAERADYAPQTGGQVRSGHGRPRPLGDVHDQSGRDTDNPDSTTTDFRGPSQSSSPRESDSSS